MNSVESICFKEKRSGNLILLTVDTVLTDFNYLLFNEQWLCLMSSGCVSICCFLLKWVLNLGDIFNGLQLYLINYFWNYANFSDFLT